MDLKRLQEPDLAYQFRSEFSNSVKLQFDTQVNEMRLIILYSLDNFSNDTTRLYVTVRDIASALALTAYDQSKS